MKKLKGIGGKLDTAWSELVKLEAGHKCEVCGKESYLNDKGRLVGLQSHHIFSRSNYSTRWDETNGVCLCPSHHVLNSKFSAHKTPTEFTFWLEEEYGREYLEDLSRKAHSTRKWMKFEKEELLEELKNKIEKYKQLK